MMKEPSLLLPIECNIVYKLAYSQKSRITTLTKTCYLVATFQLHSCVHILVIASLAPKASFQIHMRTTEYTGSSRNPPAGADFA